MQYSDTTDQTGMVQQFEFWTRLPYGSSGNLLKTITNRINAGYDNIMPLLLSYSDQVRWDDINHTDRPSGTTALVSGQNDYKVNEDENNLDILNLVKISVKTSATTSDYTELERMYPDDKRFRDAMLPNPSVTGVPTHFVEINNVFYLYPKPNYSSSDGIQMIFEREQSRFVSTDTTKEAGVPSIFQELPVLHGALDYNEVHRPDDVKLSNRIRDRIARKEQEIFDLISLKSPTRSRLSANVTDSNK